MLDQSFSAQNFNNIFLRENRKGTFDREYFSPEYLFRHEEFKVLLQEKIDLKKQQGSLTIDQLDNFQQKLQEINKQKELVRAEDFHKISAKIHEKKFTFNLNYQPGYEIFTAEETAPSFFAIKQLQYNIYKTFRVKQSNRDFIIKQLYGIVSDSYPKIIVRTDIEHFYESIPQTQLFFKIENNSLLSPISKKLIKKLFFEFENVKDISKIPPGAGIPRGVGLSPYLAELYLKDVDREIQSIDGLIYYARYVDDIVAIFCPKTESTKRDYKSELECIIQNHGLKLSVPKTETIELPLASIYTKKFTYLGYTFNLNRTGTKTFKTVLEISNDKILRYKDRIEAAILDYNLCAPYNELIARNLLILRVKFLTGNYHLSNNKRKVKAGIYYSNEMLKLNTDAYTSLRELDTAFLTKLQNLSPPPNIGISRRKMIDFFRTRFSFQKSFNSKQKSFYSFNFNRKQMSYYFTKYGRAVTGFEIIKSIWR